MARAKVRSIELRAICHATESPDKVRRALLNAVPPGLRDKVRVEETVSRGHHGNPIRMLRASLQGREAEETLRWILGELGESDLRLLELSLASRMDRGGHLYLRLDKQDAYLGRMAVGSGSDVIRVVASIRGRKPEEVVRELAGLEGKTG